MKKTGRKKTRLDAISKRFIVVLAAAIILYAAPGAAVDEHVNVNAV